MRQHMLNGWLAAALLALTCLLGATAYAEVKQAPPRTACLQGNVDVRASATTCAICGQAHCEGMAPRS
ncbi:MULTISPECIES: hypothetical protein [unclassified Mesorhizobium]|uniref:hypothetical protein n=1 Tax=unclassified Mesorhizobium TaxID=325217 RepID=UPI0011287F90|nr:MULTISPECIES: hypothetical protein [unclassified Mesorhizobium]TPN50953.1 hypothetical protein FJ976_15160 [Mesorhizobium sp. B1-1-9]TPN53015.1 hypothetical protein FJ978_09415 [Mesorhizobium sp. B1-1-7]